MHYIDTSIIAAYYCPEPLSEQAEAFLTNQIRPAISALTEVELFSAVSRKVREKTMSRADGNRVLARFLSHVDGNFFTNLPVTARHYKLARDWLGLLNTTLRTLDALHLAIASQEGMVIVSADRALGKSAKALGIEAVILE